MPFITYTLSSHYEIFSLPKGSTGLFSGVVRLGSSAVLCDCDLLFLLRTVMCRMKRFFIGIFMVWMFHIEVLRFPYRSAFLNRAVSHSLAIILTQIQAGRNHIIFYRFWVNLINNLSPVQLMNVNKGQLY